LNTLTKEIQALGLGIKTLKDGIPDPAVYSDEVGEIAWLKSTSLISRVGFGSYTDKKNSSLFSCDKSQGYCVANKNGAFISSFSSSNESWRYSGRCSFSFRINKEILFPYAFGDRGGSPATQTRGGRVLKGDIVGWYLNPGINPDCNHSSDSSFTLTTIQ
jgi:hypothetical protein